AEVAAQCIDRLSNEIIGRPYSELHNLGKLVISYFFIEFHVDCLPLSLAELSQGMEQALMLFEGALCLDDFRFQRRFCVNTVLNDFLIERLSFLKRQFANDSPAEAFQQVEFDTGYFADDFALPPEFDEQILNAVFNKVLIGCDLAAIGIEQL